jgi:hypothetical protein
MLSDHMGYWSTVLAECIPERTTRLTITRFEADPVGERVLAEAGTGVPIEEDPERTHGRGYYAGIAIGIRAHDGQDEIDLGDGGITTWTASLLGDGKERSAVSCLSVERLAALTASP